MAAIKFGVIYNARNPAETLRSVQIADSANMWLAGTYDSHFLWQEPWIHYATWAISTRNIHIGPFVTNPLTRHITVTASAAATLSVVSQNRAFIGLGRGDSAVRTMKKSPASLDVLESSIQRLRRLTSGEPVLIDGAEVRIPWANERVPIYVAAYGPKALELAGRVGDGVILQIADPQVIKWSLERVRRGAKAIGRKLENFEVISASAWCIDSDITRARKETKWFPAMVSNHAIDLLAKYPREELPESLVKGMERRGGYDYWEHARKDAHHLDFVTDEMIDQFSVIGSVSSVLQRIEELRSVGVTAAVAYLLGDDYENQTSQMAKKVVSFFDREK